MEENEIVGNVKHEGLGTFLLPPPKTTGMMVPPPWRMFALPLDGSAWVKDPLSVSTHHITGIRATRTLHVTLFKPDTKDIEYIASFL